MINAAIAKFITQVPTLDLETLLGPLHRLSRRSKKHPSPPLATAIKHPATIARVEWAHDVLLIVKKNASIH